MGGVKIKMASASTPSVMSQQGLILVHTEMLKPKGSISEKLVSSDISHIALASVLLGENPSEEVDDYWPLILSGSQFLAPVKNHQFLRFIHNNNNNNYHNPLLRPGNRKLIPYSRTFRKVMVDFKFDALQLSLHKEPPEVGLVIK